MADYLPPPRRKNTKIDVLYEMMDVLSQKEAALSGKIQALSEIEALQSQKMDVLAKILDIVP